MNTLTLPHEWVPRDYQLELFAAMDRGIKRAFLVWHRRSGKDNACFNYLVKAAHQRVAGYWVLFPTQRQARKALWDAIDNDGRRIIDRAIPHILRDTTKNDEMFVRLKNGSTIQLVGSDQFDSLVGSNVGGVVFSEYALTSPAAWLYISPILALNGGWAIFNTTPRGDNHAKKLWEQNKDNPNWFCSLRTVDDTKVVPRAIIEEERRSGVPEELIQQEYWCSFSAPNAGTVYAKEIAQARKDGRIGSVLHDPRHPVETWWDIGVRDPSAVWFVQRIGREVRLIDYLEGPDKFLPTLAKEIYRKPYSYNRHVGPHDLNVREWTADGATRKDIAKNYGLHFVVAPKLRNEDAEPAVRSFLGTCVFDATQCAQGIAALEHYHREWDETTRSFSKDPVHDWSSHGVKALQYGAVTPGHIGVMPAWAREMLQQHGTPVPPYGARPSFQVPDYDPLAHWRGSDHRFSAADWSAGR